LFRKSREKSSSLLLVMDFGYTLLAAVGLFGGIGWWLDGRVGTAPLFLIGGIFLGLAVAFHSLIRKVNAAVRKAKEKPEGDGPPGPESEGRRRE
jgi:F0F1-type ATP synthase assembly protein I